MTIFHQGPGVFIEDEIANSSDPRKHAFDTVANLKKNGFRWAAMICDEYNYEAARYLREACEAALNWVTFGTWSQNLSPNDELDLIRGLESRFHICNIETRAQEQKYTDGNLDNLTALKLPAGLAVVWTEPAWKDNADAPLSDTEKIRKWRDRTARWRMRNFFSIPEADEVGNAPSTINNMMFTSGQIGWNLEDTGPAIYFSGGYSATNYQDQIGSTGGRWCIWRLGDIGDDDYNIMSSWPKGVAPPPPPPPALTSEQVRTAITGLLNGPIEGGGLKTADANALVIEVAKSWERRQTQPTTPKQRLIVNKRIAGTTNDQWLAIDDTMDSALKSVGA